MIGLGHTDCNGVYKTTSYFGSYCTDSNKRGKELGEVVCKGVVIGHQDTPQLGKFSFKVRNSKLSVPLVLIIVLPQALTVEGLVYPNYKEHFQELLSTKDKIPMRTVHSDHMK